MRPAKPGDTGKNGVALLGLPSAGGGRLYLASKKRKKTLGNEFGVHRLKVWRVIAMGKRRGETNNG